MRDDERDGSGRDLTEIESGLAHLAPANVPPGLRGRVLDLAREARRNTGLTPRLRTVAVICGLVIAAVLAIDPLVARHETARLAALLDGPSSARTAPDDTAELAELLDSRESEADWISRLQVMAASAVRNERKSDLIEARKRLKGWIENETSEDPD